MIRLKRFDDYWNGDGNGNLSDSRTGFAKFTLLKETPPKGFLWSRRRLTIIETTTRPDHFWPERLDNSWESRSKKRTKQEWALEKPKLENVRSLREFILLIQVMKTTKTSFRMQEDDCQTQQSGNRCIKSGQAGASEMKTRFSCIAEAHESTRQRIESVTKEFTKTTLQGKDQNSVLQCKLVHTFIPMPQAMKIPDAKTAVDKEWKKLEILPSWQLDNMKDKQEVILDAQKESKNIHFATLMDICSAIRICFHHARESPHKLKK